ncbi:hypothetical protein [Sphingomonas sp. UNC305MFCol5.2]|uniref:hypothetical protein n=1 Tax=Sphingomonas sp. UNC305MFCol5.2 TaxID=1449076 RepID=UPI00068E6A0E|nr:hypothetical protein [Sphingomonas sp. UNC305MFCol5.2]
MNIKRIALLASVAGALALGACSGGKDEPEAPTSNVENMTPIVVENTATVPVDAPPATQIDNVATPHAETVPSDLSADEQTQDDADATGMTARVSRDEGGNEAQPAQ